MTEKCFTRMGQIGIAVRDINRAGAVCKKYGMVPCVPLFPQRSPYRTANSMEKSGQHPIRHADV